MVPSTALHLLELDRIALRALTFVRVGKPVTDQFLVPFDLIVECLCNLVSELGHEPLEALCAHHLPGPEHRILLELFRKVTLL